ncbi:hypothetical protein GGD81_004349 [Rhodobium orientis]|nr:hypothetical protein [Rhodobium orientis]
MTAIEPERDLEKRENSDAIRQGFWQHMGVNLPVILG